FADNIFMFIFCFLVCRKGWFYLCQPHIYFLGNFFPKVRENAFLRDRLRLNIFLVFCQKAESRFLFCISVQIDHCCFSPLSRHIRQKRFPFRDNWDALRPENYILNSNLPPSCFCNVWKKCRRPCQFSLQYRRDSAMENLLCLFCLCFFSRYWGFCNCKVRKRKRKRN